MRAVRAAWAFVTALVVAGPAAASPGEDDDADGAPFAGVTAPHPSNTTANPAALFRLPPGTYLFFQGGLRLDRIAIDRRAVDPATGVLSPAPTVADSTLAPGGRVSGVWVSGSRLLLAGAVAWRPPEDTIDRTATGYLTAGDHATAVDLTLAFSSRLHRKVLIGVSGTFSVWNRSRLRFARDTALEAAHDPARGIDSDCGGSPCGLENPQARQAWDVDVSTDFLSTGRYTVGVAVQPVADVWLGAALELPWRTGDIDRAGSVRITEAPRDGGGQLAGQATVTVRAPVVLRVGMRARLTPGWEAVAEGRYRWLDQVGPYDLHVSGPDLETADVPGWYPRPRGLSDALAAWAGFEQLDDGLRRARLGAWFGADGGAVDAAHLSPISPWSAELSAALAVQLRLGPRWSLQLGSSVRYQVPRTELAGAFDPLDRLACADSGYDRDLPACADVRAGYGLPTAAGDYRRWTHVANATLRITLR